MVSREGAKARRRIGLAAFLRAFAPSRGLSFAAIFDERLKTCQEKNSTLLWYFSQGWSRIDGLRFLIWVLCIVCLAEPRASFWAFADDIVVSRDRIEQLIRGLDAKTLAERSHAERELLELGPEVLRFLPAQEFIESVAAREAVRRIRPQIERRAARESSAASLVSFQGERTLGELVNEIASQSRNRLTLDSDAHEIHEQLIAVDWVRTPFWICLDTLCSRAKLKWQFAKDEAAINISQAVESTAEPLVIQRTGPFRLVIETAEIRLVVGDDQQRLLRINGRIQVEPRMRPLFLTTTSRELKATTDNQKPLTAWSPDAKFESPVGDGGREARINWDFRLPVGINAKTFSLRGQLHCQIAAAIERIAFDQKALVRGAIRRRGGVTVRLREVNFDPADENRLNSKIGITVSYDDGGPAFESHRSWIFHNAVYLESKSTGRTNFTDFETTQQSDGAVAVDYRWRNINAPFDQYLFVYEAPTLILDVPVNLDLADIPIAE